MNQQLLAKIRARRNVLQGTDPEEQKKPIKQQSKPRVMTNDFKERQRLLQANLFKKSQQPVELAPKEEIKGDKKGFSDARKMLQAKLNGPNSGGSSSNTGGSLPPPPMNLLPPPPLPNIMNLPPPPPPPTLTNLPPPPPLNMGNKTTILPPPPPFQPAKVEPVKQRQPQKKRQPQIQRQPERTRNIPPPTMPKTEQLKKPVQEPRKKSKSPLSNMPEPTFSNQSKKIEPPQPTRQSKNYNNNNQSKPEQKSYRQSNNYNNQQPPPRQPSNKYDNNNSSNQPQKSSSNQEQPRRETAKIFKKNPNIPEAPTQYKPKKKIFGSSQEAVDPISTDFFKKDIAGYLKRQFIKTTNILNYIGQTTKKQHGTFYFPSIVKGHRQISRKQTLYVDPKTLNLVGSFMVKNLNAIKAHDESRQAFLKKLKDYDIEKDPQKLHLKSIKQLAESVPELNYSEPNFVKMSHALKKCDSLIEQKVAIRKFTQCSQIQKIKDQTKNLLDNYCKYPEDNSDALQKLERNISKIKEMEHNV